MHGIHDNTGYINDFLHLPQNAAYEIEAPSTRTVANMVYTPSPELRQYLPSSTEFIDNMFKGTMNFFTQLCTPNKAADVINGMLGTHDSLKEYRQRAPYPCGI